jgi:periplasmic divalent cation tolerance protein
LAGATILVLTHLPDRDAALGLARVLIGGRLAACVNVGAPVESMYHWDGKIETAAEVPVVIKALAGRYAAIETAIRAHHPYELPDIVAIPFVDGYAPYLEWIAAESAPG